MRVYMVGGALGRGALDDVNVRHGEDALLARVWDLPLVPVLVHLPHHHDPLALRTHTHTHTHTMHTVVTVAQVVQVYSSSLLCALPMVWHMASNTTPVRVISSSVEPTSTITTLNYQIVKSVSVMRSNILEI